MMAMFACASNKQQLTWRLRALALQVGSRRHTRGTVKSCTARHTRAPAAGVVQPGPLATERRRKRRLVYIRTRISGRYKLDAITEQQIEVEQRNGGDGSQMQGFGRQLAMASSLQRQMSSEDDLSCAREGRQQS